MTEIQQYQQPTAPPVPSTIQQTAIELSGAMQIANAINQSTFVPAHFRGKPEECAVAILYGATIGFDPMTAVQQIYVISGKPALYSRAMVGIVLSAGHEIWVEDEQPGSVTVAGRRKGSDTVQRVTWTSEMAKTAGYTNNKKYQTDPQSMLYARASGDLARRIAPDALLGMAYNVEEMQLVPAQQAPAERATAATQKDRVLAAIGTPQTSGPVDVAGAAPEPTTAPAAGPEDPAKAPGITSSQSKKMHASFNELGVTERADRLAYASQIVGRELTSSKELSKDEASLVIESLVEALTPAEAPVEGIVVDEDGNPVSLWEQEAKA